MELRIWQVDAFAEKPFEGNPAAVVPLTCDAGEVARMAMLVEAARSQRRQILDEHALALAKQRGVALIAAREELAVAAPAWTDGAADWKELRDLAEALPPFSAKAAQAAGEQGGVATANADTFTVQVICDPKSYLYLNGTTIDFKDEIMGRGFVFNNPNAKGTCGCGESFMV